MTYTTKAIYRKGVFIPETVCDLPEGSEYELTVQGPFAAPPVVVDLEERARIMEEVVKMMRENPIPVDSPRFTREELHERR